MSEGMGSVIPIKVAEGRIFSEKLKMWDTGESCPKKVMAPQICKKQRNISSHKSKIKGSQGNTENVQDEKSFIIF